MRTLLALLFFSSSIFAGGPDTLVEMRSKAVDYLKSQRNDGAWMRHPGVTAICTQAIIEAHDETPAWMEQSVALLLSYQQEDGAFFDSQSRSPTKNYVTALSILALVADDAVVHRQALDDARDFLVGIQADEGEGYQKDVDMFYGGIGYGGDQRPDLSNLQLAIEALRASGLPADHPAIEKAQVFLARCHDVEGNPMEWAGATGGFAYSPDLPTNRNLPSEKKDGREVVPYGSMTFAGLKSLIFCEIPMNDPRIEQTMGWIERNFSVESHPSFGQSALYYYYQTLAKALELSGHSHLNLEAGKIDWRNDLAHALSKRQAKDGSWVNPSPRYMEGFPVLCTAYALNAINSAIRSYGPEPTAK